MLTDTPMGRYIDALSTAQAMRQQYREYIGQHGEDHPGACLLRETANHATTAAAIAWCDLMRAADAGHAVG